MMVMVLYVGNRNDEHTELVVSGHLRDRLPTNGIPNRFDIGRRPTDQRCASVDS